MSESAADVFENPQKVATISLWGIICCLLALAFIAIITPDGFTVLFISLLGAIVLAIPASRHTIALYKAGDLSFPGPLAQSYLIGILGFATAGLAHYNGHPRYTHLFVLVGSTFLTVAILLSIRRRMMI